MTDNTINKSLVTIQYGNISPPQLRSLLQVRYQHYIMKLAMFPPPQTHTLVHTHVEIDHSLAGQVSLVPRESYDNVGTGLTLQLLHPRLGSYKCVLLVSQER